MSGGKLVHVDRSGRDVKQYPLAEGLATLGSDPACDIRILLPTVSPHHATVVVHPNQTVIHAESSRETLVNGAPVSVAVLRHGDLIAVGGRALRWDYSTTATTSTTTSATTTTAARQSASRGALAAGEARRAVRARAQPRRGSEPPPRHLHVSSHRASMPAASTSGKQVAIVQPQRRDTSDLSATSNSPPNKRQRASKNGTNLSETPESSEGSGERSMRRTAASPRGTPNLSNTTKATLWIESRKSSPRKSAKPQTPASTLPKTPARTSKAQAKSPKSISKSVKTPLRQNVRRAASAKKSTPLRLAVLRKAQSAQKLRVTKIQAPLKMDSTKQAAIMLMTRHTPKSKSVSPRHEGRGPSYLAKKPSPMNRGTRKWSGGQLGSKATPKRSSAYSARSSDRNESVINITDSETQSTLRGRSSARRSGNKSSLQSPFLPSPKKSALKDPSAKKSNRKTESIKFDLSNLENDTYNRSSDVMLVNETVGRSLRYSDSSVTQYSAASVIENASFESPLSNRSSRGSIILKKALRSGDTSDISTYSRRTTKSVNDQSWGTTGASSRRTPSPRLSRNNLESYSIVDLVSMDSNDSLSSATGSRYTSAGSVSSNSTYDTPSFKSSTPYSRKRVINDLGKRESLTRTRSSALLPKNSKSTTSDLVTTPENTEDITKNITLNSIKISRGTKSRSRLNDSDALDDEENGSPKSSKRFSKAKGSPLASLNLSTDLITFDSPTGVRTPENRRSPVEVSTPVLSIQSLLDASHEAAKSPNSRKKSRLSNLKRKTIGVLRAESKKGRTSLKSNSLNLGRTVKGRDISANFDGDDDDDSSQEDEEVVTPKSAAKPVQEGVKNKHSTAKKPQSKRSLIDNLNESDIVKQLFNSPVKRKLSQSMTEFSRKRLFDDDEEVPSRPTRSMIALAARTPDNSHMNDTDVFSPEVFVSPLNTPNNSPNMTGIKRLFQKSTPENDLRNVRGVKGLLRTPQPRKSIRNDLRAVSHIKRVFANSPRNRLSDVRVKEVFATSPRNDLRRVSGVKALFQSQKKKRKSPRNELENFKGVKTLFKDRHPKNDLRNVSGVKGILRRNSPKNDLSDVRGVKQLLRLDKDQNDLSDLSGVERLFHESANNDSSFDQLMGRRPLRAYGKSRSFTTTRVVRRGKVSKSKSLHSSITHITENVQEWLETELRNRVRRDTTQESSTSKKTQSVNTSRKSNSTSNVSRNVSKMNLVRELQKLTTDTIDGSIPVIVSRTRNSSIIKNDLADSTSRKKSASELYSAHTLPIKKRSVIESSLNKSNNDKSHKLPIKKRAVVHSTPVKERINMTINASVISRMSPISFADKTTRIEINRTTAEPLVSTKKKGSPGKLKATIVTNGKSKETLKPSPKKTRSTKAAQSPALARALRRRVTKNENKDVSNVKKRRSSIVISKKAPILSPRPASPKVTRKGKSLAKGKQQVVPKVSPKKTRSAKTQVSQDQADVKMTTPKKSTRAKAKRVSVIVTKPSPNMKQRVTRRAKVKIAAATKESPIPKTQSRATTSQADATEENNNKKRVLRKAPEAETELPKGTRKANTKSGPKGSSNRNKKLIDNTVDQHETVVQTRKTRNTGKTDGAQSDKGNVGAQTKKTKAKTSTEMEPKTSRRGKNLQGTEDSEPIKVGRRTRANDTVAAVATKSSGKAKAKKETPRAGRSEANVEERSDGRVTRKRKNREVDDTTSANVETKTKKKQPRTVNAADEEKRGTNAVNKGTAKLRNRSRRGAGDAPAAESEREKQPAKKNTRKAAEKQVEETVQRGRKGKAVAANPPQEKGRKKRTIADISDVETKDDKSTTKRTRGAALRPTARVAPQARVGGDGRAR